MLLKIYWWAWALTFASGMLLFAAGSFTMLTAVVYGFIAFGLTFMGMISVLPAMISHPPIEKPAKAAPVIKISSEPAKAFGVLKSA